MMVFIFVLSSMSPHDLPLIGLDDSVMHAFEYGVLAVLLLRGLVGARWVRVNGLVAWLAIVLSTFYGLSDEVHQSFVPGRTAEIADLIADAVGGTLAVGLIWGRRFF